MPVVATTGPYPSIAEVMLLVRSLINDTFPGVTGTPGEGRTFTDNAPFTVPFLNSACGELSRKLENNGVTTFTVDDFILTVPAISGVDPGLQANISYTGFFNGVNQAATPALPADLLIPLQLWERPTGSTIRFAEMDQVDVLPSQEQAAALSLWAWGQDQINLLGAIQSVDMRMRYKSKILPKITTSTNFATTVIGCADSADALAYTVAFNYQNARGGGAGPTLTASKDEAIKQMVNRYVRAQQAISFSRIPYGTEGGQPGGNADSF